MITLSKGEEVNIIVRKHWYAITVKTFIVFAGIIIPLFLFFASLFQEEARGIISLHLGPILLGLGAWMLLLWTIFFVMWTNYYLDVLYVTNKRLIDIEQFGLFSRDVVEIRLEHIQDVKVEVFGVFATMMDFGNLVVQTAGKSKETVIKHINRPHKVQKTISECRRKVLEGG